MIVTHTSRHTASAEAVFGSAARGDADRMSDRDILIVDDDVSVLRARAQALKAEGWSVASYTYAKLDAIARLGALFVQHLKLESSIVVDAEGRLAKVLSDFRPRARYESEIRDNDHLASLVRVMPDVSRGPLLAADILYVTVRNFGVLKLAERDIHVYAFDAVINALELEGVVSAGGARDLAALRFLKCLYRSGESATGHRVRDVVHKALAVLPPTHFPRALRMIDPGGILAAPGPRASAPSYLQLRDLERRYVALQGLGLADDQEHRLAELSRWIENPRAYAFVSKRVAPALRAAMRGSVQFCRVGARLS